MSDDNTQPPTSQPPPTARRSSFTGQTFADLFGTGRTASSNREGGNPPNSPPQYPGPITSAAAQAQRRRLSLTTLGLSGANGQASPFNSFRGRTESFGSANSGSIDESAIAEDDASPRDVGSTPITRRTSFGARALRDIRRGSTTGVPTMGGGGGSPGQNGTSSPPSTKRNQAPNGAISSRDAKGRGEGFNWGENFRTRAERTSSISAQGGVAPGSLASGSPTSRPGIHARAKSVAVMEPPVNEMPKPREAVRPDHFQERILKGDFYMD